jgi:hypothetical protein
MGTDETFVIPLKQRGPNVMFTLREIFYNGKTPPALRVRGNSSCRKG